MMWCREWRWFGVLALSAIATLPHAQSLRDPTLAPAGAMSGPEGPAAVEAPLLGDGVAVVVRNDKPFLVIGTRLYGVGQRFGSNRIERITETQVWLRNGSELRKISRFAGIDRKVSNPKVLSP